MDRYIQPICIIIQSIVQSTSSLYVWKRISIYNHESKEINNYFVSNMIIQYCIQLLNFISLPFLKAELQLIYFVDDNLHIMLHYAH